MFKRKRFFFWCCYALLIPAGLWGQSADSSAVASRADGVLIHYYASLHEAFEAAAAIRSASFTQPVEITLLANVILDEPLLVEDGVHVRLVAGNDNRTIKRGGNNSEYPVMWISGEAASLTLGKPSMEHELVIDGGYMNTPPIYAHAPLIALNGPDAQLVMYDKVTLQHNYNNGAGVGAGVVIRADGDIFDRQAEFIMKGGTIRGNISRTQSPAAKGAGVYVVGSGRFIMEGGVITGNTARITGGGVHIGARGSFKKTGGIIYGNKAVDGFGSPKIHGHAISVDIRSAYYFRDDTVKENEPLTFTGAPAGAGIFGEGEKWDTPDKLIRRRLLSVIVSAALTGSLVFFAVRKKTSKKRLHTAVGAARHAPKTIPENSVFSMTPDLTAREQKIAELLLTGLSLKQIAYALQLSYSGVTFHAQNLYRKLGVQSRTEMFARFGRS